MQNCSSIKIIVAESHKLIKEGLIILLNSFQNFMVIDEAEDGYELISKCKKYPPDVVLVDLDLSDPDSISSIQTVKSKNRKIKIVIMTASEDTKICRSSIRKISNGIVSKQICP
ncbi:MAG: response regulator transcription factor, partial [Ignavibacteria bacterium]|nr:response regulator transcription factor [Ignavibacteria bacterium]